MLPSPVHGISGAIAAGRHPRAHEPAEAAGGMRWSMHRVAQRPGEGAGQPASTGPAGA